MHARYSPRRCVGDVNFVLPGPTVYRQGHHRLAASMRTDSYEIEHAEDAQIRSRFNKSTFTWPPARFACFHDVFLAT